MARSELVIDDTAAARRELRAGQYGQHQNAEDLIRAHFASISPEVRSALRKGENVDALEQAKENGAESQIEVPEGGKLLAWTVRGDKEDAQVISYVWEDSFGVAHHGAQGLTDKYVVPAESPSDRALREVAMHDARKKAAVQDLDAQIEEKLAKHREELQVELQAQFARFSDELSANLAKVLGEKPAESKAAEPEQASVPATDSSGPSGTAGVENATQESPAEYPKQHAALNDLLNKSGKGEPEGWDDLKVDQKIEALQELGVTAEAQS